MKPRILLLWLVLAASAMAVIYCSRKPALTRTTPVAVPSTVVSAPAPVAEQVTPSAPVSIAENSSPAPAAAPAIKSEKKKHVQNNGNINNTISNASPGKPPLQDPDARVALSLVGADPAAEAYWIGAISDTSLPDQEREDLMEDLNEDGLSDPKHPGPQDVSLILNRLALIEQIAPNADPFMQEHLGEAYKDLNNMLEGKPVQ